MDFALIPKFLPHIVMQCLKTTLRPHLLQTRINSELLKEFLLPAFLQFWELFFTSEWVGLLDRLAFSLLFLSSHFLQPLLLSPAYRSLQRQRIPKSAQEVHTFLFLDALVLKLELRLDCHSTLLKL